METSQYICQIETNGQSYGPPDNPIANVSIDASIGDILTIDFGNHWTRHSRYIIIDGQIVLEENSRGTSTYQYTLIDNCYIECYLDQRDNILTVEITNR